MHKIDIKAEKINLETAAANIHTKANFFIDSAYREKIYSGNV
jgi:hypothetical protein